MFAWLLARQNQGQFILRIEDTDKVREVEGSEAHIMESLRWLGIEWDAGPDKPGEQGPYRQSERLDIYKKWGQKLVDSGRAYADPYSPAELEEFRNKAREEKRPFLFRDHRPEDPPTWDGSQPLRFRSEPKDYKWHDEVVGDLSTGPEAVDDFILIKSDGYPTYNFAHIIDDHLMGMTHVIRSQEFLASMPKFLNLYDALGMQWPAFATLPYVMGPDGKKKLSKRDGAKDILDYRADGYLPQALVSFLATLGWNDGTTQEIYTREELIEKFDLSRVQKGGAKFDEQRLLWINGSLIRQMGLDELLELVELFWPQAAGGSDEGYKKAVLALVQDRLKYFAELPGLTELFFEEPSPEKILELYNDPKTSKMIDQSPENIAQMIRSVIEELGQSDFSQEDLKNRLNKLLDSLGTSPKVLFSIVRIAITGTQYSPELFGTLSVLGKEKSLERLRKTAESLGPQA
jgi:glutamyl-tRNA synthetase